jgi:hypothetical protein
MAAIGHSLYDRVGALSQTVATSYWHLVSLDPSPVAPAACVEDPAVAWVADRAVRGEALPVNTATETALSSAAHQLRALVELAELFG